MPPKLPVPSVPFVPHPEPVIAGNGKAANPRILFGKLKKIIRVVRGGVKETGFGYDTRGACRGKRRPGTVRISESMWYADHPSIMVDTPIQIGPEALQRRLDAGEAIQLLDVREVWEHEIARLEGATLIPLGELTERVGELDPEAPLVVYCHHGMRSYQAVVWLRQSGFPRAQNLAGGIDRWSQVIDPMVVRYQ